jgi:hypothetical protein
MAELGTASPYISRAGFLGIPVLRGAGRADRGGRLLKRRHTATKDEAVGTDTRARDVHTGTTPRMPIMEICQNQLAP